MSSPSADEQAAKMAEFREVVGTDMDESLCTALLASNSWSVEATVRQFFEGPSPAAAFRPPPSMVDDGVDDDDEEFNNDEEEPLFRQPKFTDNNNNHDTDDEDEDDDDEEEEGSSDEFAARGAAGVRRRQARPVSASASQQHPHQHQQQQQQQRRGGNAAAGAPVVAAATAAPSFLSLVRDALCGTQDLTTAAVSGAAAARKFATEFDRLVGPNSPVPQFVECSFDDALVAATRERRMLCIYLHSPAHPQADAFCKNIVCSRAVLQALSDVRMWGGSVETCDGYLASSKLQCCAFPALVVLSGVEGGRDARIVDRIYADDAAGGLAVQAAAQPVVTEAERVAMRITAARNYRVVGGGVPPPTQQAQPQAAAAGFRARQDQQQARELEERRRMVQEQDAALQRAIEDDQRRQQERLAAELAEQEAKLQAERQKLQEQQAWLDKRAQVLPEPDAGGGGVATLRFNFPHGQKLSRRFLSTDTVGYVRLVLECYLKDQQEAKKEKEEGEEQKMKRFALSSNFPKRVYDNDEETLQQAGLTPQAALFVQDLDA